MYFEAKTEMVKGADGKETAQNLVTVKVSEAEGFTLYLQEGLIDLDHPVTVKVNGDVIIDNMAVERDWEFFWETVVPRRFFMVPYTGRMKVKFDLVREFTARKK